VNDLVSSRLITYWLQETTLEQFSAISSYLYVCLVKDVKLLKGDVSLLTSVLSVITSAMRLSMKRKIYQPHFTLSVHGIFSMCQAIGGSSRSMEFKPAIELGIDAILMNGPMPILPETVLYLCTHLFQKPLKWHFSILLSPKTVYSVLFHIDFLSP
jgi:nucleolar pre-ribosomal-associated protein 1